MIRSSITTLLTLFCVVTAVAQDHRIEAVQSLPEASRSFVAELNIWTDFSTTRTANGRIDDELGILRAAYRLSLDMNPESTLEATVRSWLARDGEDFGIGAPEALQLVQKKETFGAHHLTFQQTLAGVPVYGRFVHVNLNRAGLPVMAISGYAPHLERVDAFHPVPALSATQAESLAQRAVSRDGAISTPAELLVLPGQPPRLIWRIVAWRDDTPEEWEVLLDANTGQLIQLLDQRVYSHAHPDPPPSKVDGEGQVWLYDPLTASGASYGGDYVDNNDKNNAALSALLQTVTLQDIEQGDDGNYRLRGPWVRITGEDAPVESDPTDFKYTRDNPNFEAVMVYYYIDMSERYIQSLDVGRSPPSRPISADPYAFSQDNSYYLPSRRSLHFGYGGVDDAEDAGVILHEYGHAIMHHHLGFRTRPLQEWGVLGEGFGDYWAVSYRRDLMDRGLVPARDWKQVFPWDGVAWGGRRVDGNHDYDVIQRDCRGTCNIYTYGRTWASLMMKLWERIGRENADRLHLAGFSYLEPSNFKLPDMVEALIMADEALNNGQYTADIYEIFEPKGFIDSPNGIPAITHTPLDWHMDLTLPLKLDADIEVTEFSITSADLHYRLDSGEFEIKALTHEGGTRWSTELMFPASAVLLEYYFRASSEVAAATRPRSAPEDLWSVRLGPDTQAPAITYTPVMHVVPEEVRDPLSIQVTDDNAVSRVTLAYTIHEPRQERTTSGTLELQRSGSSTYTLKMPFPDVPESALPGVWVEYQIIAYDVADPPNRAVFPPSEAPQLRLDAIPGPKQLGVWNPEDWPNLGGGEWASREDGFEYEGMLWVTAPDGPYSDKPAQSLLSFPEVNVVGYPDAHLEFWHWHDFEHSNVPGPGEAGGILYDGGQIQFSTDGGQSWSVAEPQWGYNGDIESTLSNPLSGTRAFGGSSFGWRRVRVPLPDAPAGAYRFEVHTRLAFGTGTGNSNATTDNYAGWAVRDIRVFTDPPVEKTPPVIHRAPLAHQFIPPGKTTTTMQVAASDDTGIESVRLYLYRSDQAQLPFLGDYRLNPLWTNPDGFRASIPIPDLPPGAELGYYIMVRDFDSNLRILGEEPPGELLKLYAPSRTPQTALTNGRLNGTWTDSEEGYLARTNTSERQSSLVLAPAYFADRPARTMLRLRHAYQLSDESLGQISVTEDGGGTWNALVSGTGYSDIHQSGIDVFFGSSPEVVESWFDLTSLRQPYQLRLDLIRGRQQRADGFWQVFSAEYYHLERDTPAIPSPDDLVLYPNFPNPFTGETTINYILPEATDVRITVYNLLGQNIQNVTDRRHEAGGYAINLNLHGFAPGVYWIRMQAGNKLLQQSITLVR